MREAAELSSSPSPDYHAIPLETDLFEWHFTLRGPPNSVYAEGIYHGRIVLPPTYPLRPPSFRFSTPSGRFEANREICLSISGHHEETWQPAWGLRTALVALRSFMETNAKGQIGGMDTAPAVRERMARESGGWKCGVCGDRTNAEIMREQEEEVRRKEEENKAKGEGSARQEVEVPAELSLGFRDEMEKAREAAAGAAGASYSSGEQGDTPASSGNGMDAESAQLAEGFVRTTSLLPLPADLPVDPAASPLERTEQPQFPQPRPVLQPTRTIPLPQAPGDNVGEAYQNQAQLRQRGAVNDGVPMWIDRLIVLIGVLLAGMVLKVFLGE